MTLLVLNRRRILDHIPEWLPDSARDVVVLTAASALAAVDVDRLGRRLRHLEVVADYDGAATDELIDRLCRTHRVDRILTTSEGDMLRAAATRARYGLAGTTMDSAVAYRDKYVMKTKAAAAGVRVAPMARVAGGADVAAFVARYGFPVLVKQRLGQASVGMTRVADQADLDHLTRTWDQATGGRPMLVEGWLDGDLFHVDGLMDAGRVLRSWPSRYLTPNWDVVRRGEPCLSGMLHPQDPLLPRLQDATAAVVAALPPPVGIHPFHAEFFVLADGSLLLCEIAGRAGGGRIVDVWERAYGVNLYQAGLRGQAGAAVDTGPGMPRERLGFAMFPPRAGRLTRLPERCPLGSVVEYSVTAPLGSIHRPAQASSDQIGDAVLRLSDPDTAAELVAVRDWWEAAVSWNAA